MKLRSKGTYTLHKLVNILGCLFLCAMSAHAAQTGKVDYPYLGIQLLVPEGWQGAESDDMFVMGSTTKPGLLAIMSNEAKSLEQLKSEADRGVSEEGILLKRSSDFIKIGAEGLGAEFKGRIEGEQAKAFIIGLLNPFGSSVTIVAVTTEARYTDEYKELAMEISDSVGFAIPQDTTETKDWREGLKGKRLTYMYSRSDTGPSYSDSTGNVYGSYSGYNTTTTFDLCRDGTFSYHHSSQSSFDNVGGFGVAAGRDKSLGTWKVSTRADGGSILEFQYPNGEEAEYELTYDKGKTLLNGTRYFRTQSEKCR